MLAQLLIPTYEAIYGGRQLCLAAIAKPTAPG
jgi:hypothetical protein